MAGENPGSACWPGIVRLSLSLRRGESLHHGLQALVGADRVGDFLEQALGVGDGLPLPLTDLLRPYALAFGTVGPTGFPEHGKVFLVGLLVESDLHLFIVMRAEQLNAGTSFSLAETRRH